MANAILRNWSLDQQCKKSVVIVLATDDKRFWVARDDRVPVYANEFTEIFSNEVVLLIFMTYFQFTVVFHRLSKLSSPSLCDKWNCQKICISI